MGGFDMSWVWELWPIGLALLVALGLGIWIVVVSRRRQREDAHDAEARVEARRRAEEASSAAAVVQAAPIDPPLEILRRTLYEPPSPQNWATLRALLCTADQPLLDYALPFLQDDWENWRAQMNPVLHYREPLTHGHHTVVIARDDLMEDLRKYEIPESAMWCLVRMSADSPDALRALLDKQQPTGVMPWIPARWLHDRATGASSVGAQIAQKRFNHFTGNHHDVPAILLEPGTFVMGSPEGEFGRDPDETQHTVNFTSHVVIGARPVLIGEWRCARQWDRDMPTDRPVHNINWFDAVEHCTEVGDGARLLTEAEWEYMCRAGTTTATYAGDLAEDDTLRAETLARVARWSGRDASLDDWRTRRPNLWGFYDTLGHVAEWTGDFYGPYPEGEVSDPTGPAAGGDRVFRGGGYLADAHAIRAADRAHAAPQFRHRALGLRVARTVRPPWA